jgi:hypothetical protein
MVGDEKIIQSMNFPANHPMHPGKQKGMKAVLEERGLWKTGLLMECKTCEPMAMHCCAKHILDLQPDFVAQTSLVQEVIMMAGHLCIFLLKFHCELNFIEFFWGAVKKYLRDNCDYTFPGLQKNMPAALASVQISTIQKWEHWMIRWMQAYWTGLGPKAAQFEVKKFSINLIDVLLNGWHTFLTQPHRYRSYLSYLILSYIIVPIPVRK